jgi:enoyl-CoA hydratase
MLVESPKQPHFVDEMRMEYGLMVRLIRHPDFREGVRALLVDRDNAPVWAPEADVDSFFEPLPDDEAWSPI